MSCQSVPVRFTLRPAVALPHGPQRADAAGSKSLGSSRTSDEAVDPIDEPCRRRSPGAETRAVLGAVGPA